jgi:serpin B
MDIKGKNGYGALVAPYARFSLRLIKEIIRQEADSNVVVSPTSIAIALSMICNGAAGDTQSAIAQVLELDDLSLEAVNSANAALLAEWRELDAQIVLTLRNWIEVGSSSINPAFLQTNQKFYQAEVINGTTNKLNLANTVRFKGAWTKPFDHSLTRKRLFILPNGAMKYCSMMASPYQSWAYYRHPRFELVRLPYGEQRASMYLLLPDESTHLSEFMDELTVENWRSWLDRLVDTDGDVLLPRFEVGYDIALQTILQSLGMEIAFDPDRADFSAMGSSSAFIDRVQHSAQIEVNEEGTEASAETLIEVTLGGLPLQKETFHMIVDRPFVYLIQDDRAGMLLFLGIMVDPEPLTPPIRGESKAVEAENLSSVIALSYALDLVTAGLEQGIGFDAALGQVYEQYDDALAQQFGRVLREIQLGKPRREALKDMADRMGVPDLTEFVEAVIRADQVGERLLEVVRTQARRLRTKYRGQ